MREIDRGFRAVVRTLRKEQEREARIDALTAMVKKHEAAARALANSYEWLLNHHGYAADVPARECIRRARALIGEDGKP